jgi:hypothetical protein
VLEDVGGGVLALVAGAALLVGVLLLLHGSSWLFYRVRHRDSFLIVFHPTAFGTGARPSDQTPAAGHEVTQELLAKVREYIGADPHGSVAPGALESAAPATSAESISAEALSSAPGLATAFLTLARAQRPGYHVYLTRLDGGGSRTPPVELGPSAAADRVLLRAWMRVAVTIVRQPGSRLVASRTVEVTGDELDPAEVTERAVEAIGAFCLQRVHSQLPVTRLTPRWERWRSDVAYREYRKGLEMRDRALDQQAEEYHAHAQLRQATQERGRVQAELARSRAAAPAGAQDPTADLLDARADQLDRLVDELAPQVRRTVWWQMLVRAAEHFRRASLADLANLLPRQAEAAVLELLGDHETARLIYQSCHELWPEQVEQLYRLAVYHQRGPGYGRAEPPAAGGHDVYLREATRQLRWSRLARRWLGTWLPWRWAPGERRYWASWLRPSHPQAPRLSLPTRRREFLVALRVARLSLRLMGYAPEAARGLPTPEQASSHTGRLLTELVRHVGTRPWPDPLATTGHASHRPVRPVAGRRRAGWLAHYNAACAYSQAIELPDEHLPGAATPEQWRSACAEAALRRLNEVLRDPYSQLDLSWLFTDIDLEPLARTLKALPYDHPLAGYAAFAALAARPDDARSPYGLPGTDGPAAITRARLLERALARVRPRRPDTAADPAAG